MSTTKVSETKLHIAWQEVERLQRLVENRKEGVADAQRKLLAAEVKFSELKQREG